MQVNSSRFGIQTVPSRGVMPKEEAAASAAPGETFTFSEDGGKTPGIVKAGKYALATVATVGAGALGFYAGNNVGAAAAVAGTIAGAGAGVVLGGAMGMAADLFGGFMSNTNHTATAAKVGGALGVVAGGVLGGMAQNGIAGTVVGLAAGGAALMATSAATNILAD